MLHSDLILFNTFRKLVPPLEPGQVLVFYQDGLSRVVEKKGNLLPRTSRLARRKRRH